MGFANVSAELNFLWRGKQEVNNCVDWEAHVNEHNIQYCDISLVFCCGIFKSEGMAR